MTSTFYTYAHVDNNDQVFYIGSGQKGRAKNFSVRSEEWFNHRREHGLSEVIIFGEFQTKDEALEEEKKFTLKMIELDQPLVNKRIANEWGNNTRPEISGELNPNFGRTGELAPMFGKVGHLHGKFKGITIGINKQNEVVAFNGERDINTRPTRSGKFFQQGNISHVMSGRIKAHHGFTKFTRTKSTDILREYLNANFYDSKSKQVLEDYLFTQDQQTSETSSSHLQ